MDSMIHWGIIGTGNIAQKFAADIKLSSNGKLYAVASRTLDKATAFANEYSAERAYGSYEAMVQDQKVDILYIATPHPFHYEWTLKGLENGKAVLCEKPMGMNAKQVNTLISSAQKRGLFLMEGLWTRFIPITKKFLEILDAKVLGEPLFMNADFGFRATRNLDGRIYKKELGGGSLLDIGIYPIYLSLLVLGIPASVQAAARFTVTGVDSYCSMLFDYESTAKARLESTIEANTPTEAYIYCERGSLKLHSRFHHSERLTVTDLEGNETHYSLPYKGHGYLHEIEEVHSCLEAGKTESDRLPLSASLKLSEMMDQVRALIGLEYPN